MAVYLALCLFLCLGSVLWARELGFSNGIASGKKNGSDAMGIFTFGRRAVCAGGNRAVRHRL